MEKDEYRGKRAEIKEREREKEEHKENEKNMGLSYGRYEQILPRAYHSNCHVNPHLRAVSGRRKREEIA